MGTACGCHGFSTHPSPVGAVSGCGKVFLSMLWLAGGWAVPHSGGLAPPKSHIDAHLGIQSPQSNRKHIPDGLSHTWNACVIGTAPVSHTSVTWTPNSLVLGHILSKICSSASTRQTVMTCRRMISEATLCPYIFGFLVFYRIDFPL